MRFYNHTLEAVTSGRAQLAALGVPVHRPDDYFCENMKSDVHMAKVLLHYEYPCMMAIYINSPLFLLQIKDRLLLEEKRIEAFEMRKNREKNRKFNKQVADLRKQEKSKDRKANIAQVTGLRKAGEAGKEKIDALLQGDEKFAGTKMGKERAGHDGRGQSSEQGKTGPQKSSKRLAMASYSLPSRFLYLRTFLYLLFNVYLRFLLPFPG
jgi:rRNA-processing protein EBP2